MAAAIVRYVVVGGVAVNLHGYQRFTKDLDLVIELIPEQTTKALAAISALGFTPTLPVNAADFANPVIRDQWIHEKGMKVFQLYSDQARISIFARYPLDFDELWAQSIEVDLPVASPRVASIDHLIYMKRDLLDVEKLEKLKQLLDQTRQGDPTNDAQARITRGQFRSRRNVPTTHGAQIHLCRASPRSAGYDQFQRRRRSPKSSTALAGRSATKGRMRLEVTVT